MCMYWKQTDICKHLVNTPRIHSTRADVHIHNMQLFALTCSRLLHSGGYEFRNRCKAVSNRRYPVDDWRDGVLGYIAQQTPWWQAFPHPVHGGSAP